MQNHLNLKQESALIILCQESKNDDRIELLKILLEKGVNINQCDTTQNTPLMYLVSGNNSKSAQLLLNYEEQKSLLYNILPNHIIKSVENDIPIVDWRQKYLRFFTDNKIVLEPLEGDEYNWEEEYERVSTYKYWNKIQMNDNYACTLLKCEAEELPKEIGNLKPRVTKLTLENCHIKKFPKEISKLVNLETLDIDMNNLDHIPQEIFSLTGLKCLFISDNKITMIPREIERLQNLEKLRIDGNPLAEQLGLQMINLKKLCSISVSRNQLAKILVVITEMPQVYLNIY